MSSRNADHTHLWERCTCDVRGCTRATCHLCPALREGGRVVPAWASAPSPDFPDSPENDPARYGY